MNKYTLLIFFSLLACTPSIPFDQELLLMNEKLKNTEWKSNDFFSNKYISFSENEVKLNIGTVLGSKPTFFTIIDQDQTYALYSIYEEYLPSFLGVSQIDKNKVKLLVWQSNIVPTKNEIIQVIEQKGTVFKLVKHVK